MNPNELYRPNVAAVIVSSKYPQKSEVFIAERNDIPDAWQFPQGGIDDNETPRQALLRELKEEIGTDEVTVIAEYPEWISYEFPESVQEKMKPFIGQSQRYFLVRLKPSAKVNISTEHPEFSAFRFEGLNTLFSTVSHFKRPIYKQVVKYFQKEGYL